MDSPKLSVALIEKFEPRSAGGPLPCQLLPLEWLRVTVVGVPPPSSKVTTTAETVPSSLTLASKTLDPGGPMMHRPATLVMTGGVFGGPVRVVFTVTRNEPPLHATRMRPL